MYPRACPLACLSLCKPQSLDCTARTLFAWVLCVRMLAEGWLCPLHSSATRGHPAWPSSPLAVQAAFMLVESSTAM